MELFGQTLCLFLYQTRSEYEISGVALALPCLPYFPFNLIHFLQLMHKIVRLYRYINIRCRFYSLLQYSRKCKQAVSVLPQAKTMPDVLTRYP